MAAFRNFEPAGPVANAFAKDQSSIVKMLLGPVGGGKSVACTFDSVRRPSLMPPCNDGVIRYRRAIIGSTYGQIERNLYPTWWRWMPRTDGWTEGEWQGGGGRFARHMAYWQVRRRIDGQMRLVDVNAEYIFAAIGDLVVEEFMRGFETTDFWLYEADQLPEAVLSTAVTRLLRYPPTGDAPDALRQDAAFQPQIVGDLNAPDVDSWFFRIFEEEKPPGFRVYKQPGGRTAHAENRKHLAKDYYENQVRVLSAQRGGRHLVRRMVDAQYGPSLIGEPVYADIYDDAMHLAPEPLKPLPNIPLVMGFDQGLGFPAAVIAQITPKGQVRILAECCPGRMSARRFAAEVRSTIIEVAPDTRIADVHYADPAGFDGADREDGELAWAEIVAAELGIVIEPCETNEIEARLTAVIDDLTYMIGPGETALLISPVCRMLRKGFVSHYMYEKRPAEKSQNRKPVKNPWSNPHDALQYLELGRKGRYGVVEGRRDPRDPRRALGHKSGQGRDGGDGCTVIRAPVDI